MCLILSRKTGTGILHDVMSCLVDKDRRKCKKVTNMDGELLCETVDRFTYVKYNFLHS